jgi:hypothetical protein
MYNKHKKMLDIDFSVMLTKAPMLKGWIKKEGTTGRRRLFEAIRAEQPNFTQASLTQYINGDRTPSFGIAQIIAEITGIPVFLLPFRFVNRPDNKL